MNKPPIGLLPKYLHDEMFLDDTSSTQRQQSIETAIKRYELANMPVPHSWRIELAAIKKATK